MAKDFLVKMPLLVLPPDAKDGLANQRAIILFGQALDFNTVNVLLFLESGKSTFAQINKATFLKVTTFGPFINLAEVKHIDRESMPILGPDGSPIIT